MPPEDSLVDWQAKVTLVLSFDPDSGSLIVDRGVLPRMFANAILGQIEDGDWAYTDEAYEFSEEGE